MARLRPKKHKNAKIVEEGHRPCPICLNDMYTDVEFGISIDVCPKHGVWLDKGELDKITSRLRRRMNINHQKNLEDARREATLSSSIFGLLS